MGRHLVQDQRGGLMAIAQDMQSNRLLDGFISSVLLIAALLGEFFFGGRQSSIGFLACHILTSKSPRWFHLFAGPGGFMAYQAGQ